MAQTLNEIYLQMRQQLRAGGVEAYALEARLLLAHACGMDENRMLANMHLYPSSNIIAAANDYVRRRLLGEPCAYILGSWEFFGMPMIVTPDVLIPRMDTEVLVYTALELAKGKTGPLRVFDLCTGSGCIGCALAKHLPGSRVVLGDISPDARAIARKNILLNDLSRQAICMEADALSPAPDNLGQYDLLVSNPPYITPEEILTLDSSVKDWEPRLALDGGEDGLMFYRSIISGWKSVLKDNGSIILELGEGQAPAVRELLAQAGFQNIGGRFDTLGVERVVYGTLSSKI